MLVAEMMDVGRFGRYGGKLHLVCQDWYIWSTWIHKIHILTVTTMRIVILTIQYNSISSISFMYHPWDFFRWTSTDILSRKAYLVYFGQLRHSGHRNPQLFLVNKQTLLDWLIANRGMVNNLSNLQLDGAWFNLSATFNLVVTYFNLIFAKYIFLRTSHIFSLSSSSPILHQ